MQADSTLQRVKVYRLNSDGLWDDKGTGHVSVEHMEHSHSLGLVVVSEEDTRTLLVHRISAEDIYQRQGEETIITWSDPEIGTDIALSFQESAGCNHIWKQVQQVQLDSNSRKPESPGDKGNWGRIVDEFDQVAGQGPEGEYGPSASANIDLPPPELGNLPEIAKVLTDVSPFQKEKLAAKLMANDYVPKLLEAFQTAEDLEDAASLKLLHAVFKGAIMLNDTALLELLLAEEHVMDVVGALENDPELPERQRHREFLRDHVVFREVVPVKRTELRVKIHQTYRMGYLKDVILPRSLDDGTFATLSSLMLFNNIEVVMALQSDPRFLPELFERWRASKPGEPAWIETVAFLQELCGLAKHLQPGNRSALLQQLTSLGLFDVVSAVVESGERALVLQATDVLLSAVQHDPLPLREHMLSQQDHALFAFFIRLLVSGGDGGLQEQALEILRILLDPESMVQNVDRNDFLEIFYSNYIGQLVDAIAASGDKREEGQVTPSATSLGLIVELLCFCVQHHSYRIKYYILRTNAVEKVFTLLKRREKWLVVSAVRFLRTCLALKDEFYNRYIMQNRLFQPVVDVFLENGRRYNLLNSAVLELLDFVRRENIKSIITYLVEEFSERFKDVDYVDTFKALKLRYEQQQARDTSSQGLTEGAAPGSTAATAERQLSAIRRRPDARALDRDQEDYFAEDDEEEEAAQPSGPTLHVGNGVTGPPPKRVRVGAGSDDADPSGWWPAAGAFKPPFSLVDYDDDDDDSSNDDSSVGGGGMQRPEPRGPAAERRVRLGESLGQGIQKLAQGPNSPRLWQQ